MRGACSRSSGVRTIFGCYTSSSRKAVLPIVERLNGLLWYPTLYEGFEFSPNIVYTGAAPNQNSLSLFNYLSTSYGKRIYFVGSDYVYPRESNRIMRHLVEQSGGEVVGEMYVSLNARREEFFPILRDIKNVAPDVIFSTVVGTPTVYLYQTYADFGFKPSDDADRQPDDDGGGNQCDGKRCGRGPHHRCALFRGRGKLLRRVTS